MADSRVYTRTVLPSSCPWSSRTGSVLPPVGIWRSDPPAAGCGSPTGPPRAPTAEWTVRISGEVDLATAEAVRTALLTAVRRCPAVCCDLTDVTFFSAAGVTVLLTVSREAAHLGNRFRVRGARGVTARILRATGVDALLASGGTPAAEHP